jgi:hypothetical protein
MKSALHEFERCVVEAVECVERVTAPEAPRNVVEVVLAVHHDVGEAACPQLLAVVREPACSQLPERVAALPEQLAVRDPVADAELEVVGARRPAARLGARVGRERVDFDRRPARQRVDQLLRASSLLRALPRGFDPGVGQHSEVDVALFVGDPTTPRADEEYSVDLRKSGEELDRKLERLAVRRRQGRHSYLTSGVCSSFPAPSVNSTATAPCAS